MIPVLPPTGTGLMAQAGVKPSGRVGRGDRPPFWFELLFMAGVALALWKAVDLILWACEHVRIV